MPEIFFGVMVVFSFAYYIFCGTVTSFKAEILDFWLFSVLGFSYLFIWERYLSGFWWTLLFVLVLVPVVLFILVFLFFFFSSFSSRKHVPAPLYVLFGADREKMPEKVFLKRLRLAEKLLKEGDAKIVISGRGRTEEFGFARDYLIGKGISPDRMILETKSDTTLQNIVNSAVFGDEYCIITSRFHTPRVRILQKKLFPGKKVSVVGAEGAGMLEIHFIVREIFCLFYDVLSGRLGRAVRQFSK